MTEHVENEICARELQQKTQNVIDFRLDAEEKALIIATRKLVSLIEERLQNALEDNTSSTEIKILVGEYRDNFNQEIFTFIKKKYEYRGFKFSQDEDDLSIIISWRKYARDA